MWEFNSWLSMALEKKYLFHTKLYLPISPERSTEVMFLDSLSVSIKVLPFVYSRISSVWVIPYVCVTHIQPLPHQAFSPLILSVSHLSLPLLFTHMLRKPFKINKHGRKALSILFLFEHSNCHNLMTEFFFKIDVYLSTKRIILCLHMHAHTWKIS